MQQILVGVVTHILALIAATGFIIKTLTLQTSNGFVLGHWISPKFPNLEFMRLLNGRNLGFNLRKALLNTTGNQMQKTFMKR